MSPRRSGCRGSYLLTWPLLAALAGGAWWLDGVRRGTRRPIGVALSVVPVIFLFAPLLRMMEIGLTMSVIPVLVLLMMLALALTALATLLIGHTWRWALPLALVGGIWAITSAELNAGFGPEQKRPDSLVYLADADVGKAWWLTFDGESDAWTGQVLGASPGRASFGRYHLGWGADSLVSAPASADGAALSVEVLGSRPVAGGRRVHFRITAPGPVETITLHLERGGIHITGMTLDGRVLPDADSTTSEYAPRYRIGGDGTVLLYHGMPAGGIEMECTIDTPEPVSLQLQVRRSGLPPLASGPLTPRTNGYVAKPFLPTDVSIVSRTFRI